MKTKMMLTLALGLVFLLGGMDVQAKGPVNFRNQAVQKQLGVRTVEPQNRRSYLQRASSSFEDRAKFQGYTWVKGHMVKGKGYRRAHLRKVDTVSSTKLKTSDPDIYTVRLGRKATRVEFGAGTYLPHAAEKLVGIAQQLKKPAMGLFNGTLIYAKPGETAAAAQARYDTRREQKYASARKRMEAKKARAAVRREQRLGNLGKPLVDRPPEKMKFSSFGTWGDVRLITPKQLRALPKGTVLTSISGSRAIVGVDRIDGDTRGGFLAYGFAKDRVNPAAVLSDRPGSR
jgi:hypothetical protein